MLCSFNRSIKRLGFVTGDFDIFGRACRRFGETVSVSERGGAAFRNIPSAPRIRRCEESKFRGSSAPSRMDGVCRSFLFSGKFPLKVHRSGNNRPTQQAMTYDDSRRFDKPTLNFLSAFFFSNLTPFFVLPEIPASRFPARRRRRRSRQLPPLTFGNRARRNYFQLGLRSSVFGLRFEIRSLRFKLLLTLDFELELFFIFGLFITDTIADANTLWTAPYWFHRRSDLPVETFSFKPCEEAVSFDFPKHLPKASVRHIIVNVFRVRRKTAQLFGESFDVSLATVISFSRRDTKNQNPWRKFWIRACPSDGKCQSMFRRMRFRSGLGITFSPFLLYFSVADAPLEHRARR